MSVKPHPRLLAAPDDRVPPETVTAARTLSAASLHEAGGRIGALPREIHPIHPQFRICGPALTVHSPGGDNLWLHRALYAAAPGDVLVVHCAGRYDHGYWGDVMASAAKIRGLGGLVIDGCVRDFAMLGEIGFPVFARGLCIRGTGLAGPFLAAWAIDRFGSKPTLLVTAFSTAAAIFLVMGIIASGEHLQSDAAKWVLLTAMGLCGTASGSLSGAIYSIASMGYPPSCRASGVGLVLMIGRIGGFITILTAGALLGFNGSTPLPVFAVMAGAALVTACTALIIDRHIEGSRAIPVGAPAGAPSAPDGRKTDPVRPGAPIGHGKTE